MKKLFILSLLITFISCNSQVTNKTITIDLPTLKTEVIGKNVQFIDVRSQSEYQNGHIDNAININISNKNNFEQEVNTLDKNKPIYVYCHSGGRSNKACKVLEELGFVSIYNFSGGWKAWSAQ